MVPRARHLYTCKPENLLGGADIKLGVQVEQDLAYARLLAGLHGVRARREVGDLVSCLVEVGAGLPLPEDKLVTIMEAAQVARPLPNPVLPLVVLCTYPHDPNTTLTTL